jgi:hypothetical protein
MFLSGSTSSNTGLLGISGPENPSKWLMGMFSNETASQQVPSQIGSSPFQIVNNQAVSNPTSSGPSEAMVMELKTSRDIQILENKATGPKSPDSQEVNKPLNSPTLKSNQSWKDSIGDENLPQKDESFTKLPINRFEAYAPLQEKIERIRKACRGNLDLPQICVIGDQSSGKSTLLASISGIEFPSAHGICTKCPTIVRLEKNDSNQAEISFLKNTKTVKDIADLEQEIKAAQQAILTNFAGTKVVDEPINIVLSGPNYTPLTLIDLPGIVHSGGGELEIQAMIKKWIEPKNTLILLVRTANTENENVKALDIVER